MRMAVLGVHIGIMLLVGCSEPITVTPVQRTVGFYRPDGRSAWDSGRTEERLRSEFDTYDLEQRFDAKGVEAMRWRFRSKSIGYADAFLSHEIGTVFRSIRVRLRNAGPPVDLAMKLIDAGGAEWTVEPIELAECGWQWIRWDRSAFRIARWSRDPDGTIDLPIRGLALIAFGIRSGQAYELWVRRIDLVRDEVVVPGLRIELPEVAQADEPVPITIRFAGRPPAAPWWVGLWDEDSQMLRRKLGDLVSGQTVVVPLPRYLRGGRYVLRPTVGDMPVLVGRDAEPYDVPLVVEARPADADQTVAEVKAHGGVPTLMINDLPDACMAYMTYNPRPRPFRQFGRAGVRLFSFSATPTAAAYGLSPTAWVAPGEFDFSHLDRRARMLLDEVPDAHVFPRIYLFSPGWWDERHPDHLVTYDPGDGKPRVFRRDGRKASPSWASPVWRQDTATAIRHLIRYVEASPYADRVIGYHIASGTTEEWMMWGANENRWVDYSPVNLAAFRDWLRRRYADDRALQKGWNDPTVTLDTATIPSYRERARTRFGILRDPQQEQQVVDFTWYMSDLTAETIGLFARTIKETTGGTKLVGAFYGYLMQLMDHRQQNAAHLSLGKVLANPDIDFMTSPSSYSFRRPGEGYSHFMSLTDSVKLHGKLWIDENDYRTWLTDAPTGRWGKTDTYEATLWQERRELASVLGQGCGQWWFDMGGGWFDDDRMMQEIRQQVRIAERTLRLPRGPVAEIAVVVDDKSLAYLQPGNRLNRPLLHDLLPHLARTGAPVAYYLLSDLPNAPKHKLYVFLNALAPTRAQRQAVDALKGDGRVLMFFWASGIYRDGKLDPTGVSDLVGMKVATSDRRARLAGRFEPDSRRLGRAAGEPVGSDLMMAPSFTVVDEDAAALARDGRDRPVIAMRTHPKWTSVYSAIPVPSRAFYTALAERADVHRCIETPDVVYATQSLLAIACDHSGKRTVRLRQPARVHDLFADRRVCDGEETFEIRLDRHETALLLIQPAPK